MTEKREITNLVKSVPFPHKGDNYEFLVFLTETGYEVRTMKNEQPFPPRFIASYDVAYDFQKDIGESAYDALIDLARNRILNKTL
jgi:hypothetical protein